MQPNSNILTVLTVSNTVIVDLFADTGCNTPARNRDVFDNSCAPLGGFQSYRISSLQQLSAYSRSACAGLVTTCAPVSVTGGCGVRATSDDGQQRYELQPGLQRYPSTGGMFASSTTVFRSKL